MNLFTDLSSAWATALWRASWQAGLAVLVVWLVCRLVPTIPARFQVWLWRLAVLKFVVVLIWVAPLKVPLLPANEATSIASTTSSPSLASNAGMGAVVGQSTGTVITPLLLLLFAWCVGVVWQTIRLLTAWLDAHRLRKSCRRCEDKSMLGQLSALVESAGLRTSPSLLETDGNGSPLLVGVLRPAIVFPTTTLLRLDDAERSTVLGHELAHIRRGDLFWGLLAAVVRAMFFFHPLVWLGERKLRLTQEIAADELAIRDHDPVRYATLLVSCVSKIGPARRLPAMVVGMTGSQKSLRQRILAMRYVKPLSRRVVFAYGLALAAAALVGVVPWTLVAADAPAKEKIQEMTQTGRGRFISFKDSTLTLRNNAGGLMSWGKIVENTPTVRYDTDAGKFNPESTAALSKLKPDTWVQVIINKGKTTVRIGERKAQTVGTFVSFKDNRLLILGKNLGESYVKKYGNNVHFNRFRDDVPAYESIDGGEYKLIGTANKVLGNVKEGTVLTIHGEGDDNITLVQIGVAKK